MALAILSIRYGKEQVNALISFIHLESIGGMFQEEMKNGKNKL